MMPSSLPVVILVTDFGAADPYVGQVKGVLLRHAPGVTIVDLFHEIPAYDMASGAFVMDRCRPYMPSRAIWLCVVDPGVGSSRGLLAVAAGDAWFLGPDNGLLTPILQLPGAQAFHLAMAPLQGQNIAPTFHGRDIFAPAAAAFARGTPAAWLGPPHPQPVQLDHPGWRATAQGWQARIMLVDRYGNLITGLPGAVIGSTQVTATLGSNPCGRLVKTFADLAPGEAGLVVGGFGTVEITVNQDSAHHRFAAKAGDWVEMVAMSHRIHL